MALQIRDGGTLRTITDLTIRQAGVNRRIRTLQVLDDGVLRTVAQFADPLSANVSPSSVTGIEGDNSTVEVTTGLVTASPIGGRAPFSYSWARTSGVGSIDSALSASTRFSAFVDPFANENGTFQVTITDDAGQTATASVSANFTNRGDGIPD